MHKSERLLVAIATYNELENLPSLVEQLMATLQTCDVFVVDDSSPDGTGKWCTERAAQDERFSCLVRSGKQGLGTAEIEKMQFAIKQGYDWLMTMDADHSHDPAEAERLLTAANETSDVVIGSRYVTGGRIVNWPRRRRIASRLVNRFAQTFLTLPVSDCSTGFRCYRVDKLKTLDFGRFRSTGYSFYEEVLCHLRRQDARFVEVPITFNDRTAGNSKANSVQVLRDLFRLITLIKS